MSRKHSKQTKAPPKAGATAPLEWLQKHSLLTFVLLVAAASLRIVTTYTVFNHTIDEPAHIACGMQWLADGAYRYEPQHPPLARIAAALGPYLEGIRSYNRPGIYQEGAAILYRNGHYDRNLLLARLGTLPFFWIASLAVYVWARKCGGEPYAAIAVLLFTFLPPVLAHAGLATTDMAVTAFTGTAFVAALFGSTGRRFFAVLCSARARAWPCSLSSPRCRSSPRRWLPPLSGIWQPTGPGFPAC